MKKSILNLGKTLSKNEQQSLTGGWDSNYCVRNKICNNPSHPHYDACGCEPW